MKTVLTFAENIKHDLARFINAIAFGTAALSELLIKRCLLSASLSVRSSITLT